MLINIITVGLPKDAYIKHLTASYMDRIKNYANVSLKDIRQEPLRTKQEDIALRKEAIKFLYHMEGCYNVVLDKDGVMMDSELFAKFINKRIISGTKVMNIMIGGPAGIDSTVKQRADTVLSLSRMTFPHELSLLIVVEQVYRAFTILHGVPYHR
jgi:23S rRNA (pseudouridine1915-N3)-methyltransferase